MCIRRSTLMSLLCQTRNRQRRKGATGTSRVLMMCLSRKRSSRSQAARSRKHPCSRIKLTSNWCASNLHLMHLVSCESSRAASKSYPPLAPNASALASFLPLAAPSHLMHNLCHLCDSPHLSHSRHLRQLLISCASSPHATPRAMTPNLMRLIHHVATTLSAVSIMFDLGLTMPSP